MHEMFWAICSQTGEEFCEGTPNLVVIVIIRNISCVLLVPLGDGDTSGSVLLVGFPGFSCTGEETGSSPGTACRMSGG